MMEQQSLCSAVESILFAAESPISTARLKDIFTEGEGEEAVGPSEEEILAALEEIRNRYTDESRGFELRQASSGYHFVTKPHNVKFVRKFLATKPFRLSRSSLEVLSIVAYRQPITRAEIDSVRGIDSGHILRVLIERGLVKMAGKAEVPGRPVQYATTEKFLETVGLSDLNQLPPLSELAELQGEKPSKDPLEEGLNRFIQTTESPQKLEEASQEELAEITGMIDEAESIKEVYESPIHAEVAAANREALEAFQQAGPKRRRKAKEEEGAAEGEAETSTEAADAAEAGDAQAPSRREMSYEELVGTMAGGEDSAEEAEILSGGSDEEISLAEEAEASFAGEADLEDEGEDVVAFADSGEEAFGAADLSEADFEAAEPAGAAEFDEEAAEQAFDEELPREFSDDEAAEELAPVPPAAEALDDSPAAEDDK